MMGRFTPVQTTYQKKVSKMRRKPKSGKIGTLKSEIKWYLMVTGTYTTYIICDNFTLEVLNKYILYCIDK
jgi:hypothetical protein